MYAMLTPSLIDDLKDFSLPLKAVLGSLFVLNLITLFTGVFSFITSLFGLIFVGVGTYGVLRYSRGTLVSYSVLMFLELLLTTTLVIFLISILATSPDYQDSHWVVRPTKSVVITTTIVTGVKLVLEVVSVVLAMKLAGELKRLYYEQFLLYHPEAPAVSYQTAMITQPYTSSTTPLPNTNSQGMFTAPIWKKGQLDINSRPEDFSIE